MDRLKLLSITQRLAFLHTATFLTCTYLEFGISLPLLFAFLGSLGYLVIFVISKAEQASAAISEAKATTEKKKTSNEFSLSITDIRKNPKTDRVEYRVDGIYNDQKWSAWCRYSSLRQLKGRAGTKADEQFPQKANVAQWFRGSDSDIAFIDERRRLLNNFLREAIPNKEAFEILAQVPLVRSALGIPTSLTISSAGGKLRLEDVMKEALTALDMTAEIASYADNSGDGWNLYSQADGISCYLKKEGEFTYAMGKGMMDVDKLKVALFIGNLQYRKTWDELFKFQNELQSFQKYDPNFTYPPEEDPLKSGRSADWEILSLSVAHAGFSSPAKAFVAERDSVSVLVLARRRKDGAIVIGLRSIEDPRAPPGVDGYIRAKVIVAGFLMEDRKDGKPGCIMTTMGLVDPNGS